MSSRPDDPRVAAEPTPEQSGRTVAAAVHQAMEREARHYQGLFDLAPDGYLVTDVSGGILNANRAAADLLGVPQHQLPGKPLVVYVAEEQRGLFLSRVSSLQRGEAVPSWEARLNGPARDPVYVVLTVAQRKDEGRVTDLLWILHDLSARRREEEERLRLESQMQQALRLESLGVLAGGIAHDFNNLLTGILVNAGLAALEIPADDPLRSTLQQIESAALRAADLTRQLLAYSGRGRVLIQGINLSRFVEEMAASLRTSIATRAVLEFALTPDLPAFDGDPGQINQIVRNLVTNASEALDDKEGVIRVATGVVHADHAVLSTMRFNRDVSEGDYVSLDVSDTGRGMDEVTAARMFDPFFSTKAAGRGLGLSAVLGIARRHRAALAVTSEPGRGARFQVLFPCSGTEEEVALAEPSEGRQRSGTGTVLVMEDEEVIRSLTRLVLEKAGFRVLVAADGREGLELFERHRQEVAAVVVDLTMPRLSGTDVLVELWKENPGLPAVLMSGYDEQEADSQVRGKGDFAFLQKPFRPAELVSAVRRRLQG